MHGCILRRTHTHTHTPSQLGEEVAWEVNLIRKWNNGSKGVLHNTSSVAFPKPTWHLRLICIQIRSCCITSSVNYGIQMERLRQGWRKWLDRQLQPSQKWKSNSARKRRRNDPPLHSPLSSLGVSDIFFPFRASPCTRRGDHFLCTCDGRIFLITHLSQNQDEYTGPLVIVITCTQHQLTLRGEVCLPEALS